jgi:L-fucose mutarotase/ribose pyranase (RbsD/FucU family)
MRIWPALFLCALVCSGLCAGGQRAQAAAAQDGPDWRQVLRRRLPEYGHRNWIVVADSAYPAQSAPGIETIVSGQGQVEVLRAVLEVLRHAPHVTPIVHVDQELELLDEEDAHGITTYRQDLETLFQGRPVERLPHEQIIKNLDAVSQAFRVLIIKTNITLPYTSVFLQLDCAYWGGDAEKRLREKMGGH